MLDKIKNMLSVEATVIRDGERFDIPIARTGPRDLVYFRSWG